MKFGSHSCKLAKDGVLNEVKKLTFTCSIPLLNPSMTTNLHNLVLLWLLSLILFHHSYLTLYLVLL